MRRLFVTLGAYGDICGILPLLWHSFRQGDDATLLVSHDYADIMDGVGYADRRIWPHRYHTLPEAIQHARTLGFDKIHVTQCYGLRTPMDKSSFIEQMWHMGGFGELWGQDIPLVFDRRDEKREAELVAKYKTTDRPLLLVCTSGRSSPISQQQLRCIANAVGNCGERFEIVDISTIRAHHFYDLLGLYEKAEYLIAIDSGPLHLANACPKLKVIALVTDRPTRWYGAPHRPNHVLSLRYSEIESRWREIEEALKSHGRDRRITHVFSDYDRKWDAQFRHVGAKASWVNAKNGCNWVTMPVRSNALLRNSVSVGEAKDTPFVNDLIDFACAHSHKDDLILLTNDDTLIVCDFIAMIAGREIFWGSRKEIDMGFCSLISGDLVGLPTHPGADIFMFPRSWWDENRTKMPEMLIGFESWDIVLRTLINMNGGTEIPNLVAHLRHDPDWRKPEHREGPGNLFNRRQAMKFFANLGGIREFA